MGPNTLVAKAWHSVSFSGTPGCPTVKASFPSVVYPFARSDDEDLSLNPISDQHLSKCAAEPTIDVMAAHNVDGANFKNTTDENDDAQLLWIS